ncbi:hypothetical protein RSSM_02313 [Rhodopirellula sallentina SM41]|uniref:Uncharacterized protein n=1 Tax=Rhodopirellula sallentina SM41 TaxID=1263870 RepID=M5UJT2_9BACT|nr:hypothetical protein RSSM_02313 [Rhodopirellula sallentina SM41]
MCQNGKLRSFPVFHGFYAISMCRQKSHIKSTRQHPCDHNEHTWRL